MSDGMRLPPPQLASLVSLAFAVSLAACAARPDTADPDDDVGDDATAQMSAISGSVPMGSELVTTANVNLRASPSTSARVLRTLPKGTRVAVLQSAPEGRFHRVRAGADEGWVHGAYLAPVAPETPAAPAAPAAGCTERRLRFSADELPALPSGAGWVWGGNATSGEHLLDPPYASGFLDRARAARARGQQVFAYLEGPCGDTGGVDDGERARCSSLHRDFNRRFAPGTPDTAAARWKPYTMKQLRMSGALGVDYCEIDNLENNVTIPLVPLAKEIKQLHDGGEVHCRLVLKNVDAAAIDALRASVAPTPADADFVAPFAIFEADDTGQKARLDAAMRRLKGPGAVTVVSTDTNHYGSAFTQDRFAACD